MDVLTRAQEHPCLSVLLGHWGVQTRSHAGALQCPCTGSLPACGASLPGHPCLGSVAALGQPCPGFPLRAPQPAPTQGAEGVTAWDSARALRIPAGALGSSRGCRAALPGLLAGTGEHLAAWDLLPGIAACSSPYCGEIGMGPHRHIQRGAVLVQGPGIFRMVLGLGWCLPHQKACICIEMPQIQW